MSSSLTHYLPESRASGSALSRVREPRLWLDAAPWLRAARAAAASRRPRCLGRHCSGWARRDGPSHRPPAPQATAAQSRLAPAAGWSAGARGPLARPPFFHPLQALGHGVEALRELETGRRQRRSAIVGAGTPDGAAVPPYALGPIVSGINLAEGALGNRAIR